MGSLYLMNENTPGVPRFISKSIGFKSNTSFLKNSVSITKKLNRLLGNFQELMILTEASLKKNEKFAFTHNE